MRKIFSGTLCLILAMTMVPAAAFGEVGEVSSDGTTIVLQPTTSYYPNHIKVALSYSAPIKCNEATEFTVIATGLTGTFMYKPYSLSVAGTNEQVQDFSYNGYTSSDKLSITFNASGTYKLRLRVNDVTMRDTYTDGTPCEPFRDMSVYTDPVFTVEVADPTTMSQSQIAQKAKEVADKAYADCLRAGCKTEYEKALWLHDWVLDHCTYDHSLRHCKANDVFVFGTGTCEAYFAAYKTLLNRAGIANGRTSDNGHVWNLVRLDGSWCHIDCTQDDSEGPDTLIGEDAKHMYFGLNDAIIESKLAVNGQRIQVKQPSVSATSLASNYLIRTGAIKKYSQYFDGAVSANLSKGMTSSSIRVEHPSWPPTYKALLYGLVAYQLGSRSWQMNGKTARPSFSYANDSIHYSLKSISAAQVSGICSKPYNGRPLTQNVQIKMGAVLLVQGRDYILSYANNVFPGTAQIVIQGSGAYTGTKSVPFSIVKTSQPMTCKARYKTKKISASKIRKKNMLISCPVKAKGAKCAVRYSNVSNAGKAKRVKVNSRTGKVTVPKGMRKGVYKIRIKVSAAGSNLYRPTSEYATFTIRIS